MVLLKMIVVFFFILVLPHSFEGGGPLSHPLIFVVIISGVRNVRSVCPRLAIIIFVMARSSNIYFPKLETWNLKFKYGFRFFLQCSSSNFVSTGYWC